MKWNVILSRSAVKDARRLKQAGLKSQAAKLLNILMENPFQDYPGYEKLTGNLRGFYSRRTTYSIAWSTQLTRKTELSMYCACGHIMNKGR